MNAVGRLLRSSPDERAQPFTESSFVLDFALPNDGHSEAERPHRVLFASITFLVPTDLVAPPSLVRLGQASERARPVSMPEASVNEDAPTLLLVGDIRPARQVCGTNSIPSTQSVQKLTNRLFGSSVAPTHGLHADRRLGRDSVPDAL
jgi:hypothetical protein